MGMDDPLAAQQNASRATAKQDAQAKEILDDIKKTSEKLNKKTPHHVNKTAPPQVNPTLVFNGEILILTSSKSNIGI